MSVNALNKFCDRYIFNIANFKTRRLTISASRNFFNCRNNFLIYYIFSRRNNSLELQIKALGEEKNQIEAKLSESAEKSAEERESFESQLRSKTEEAATLRDEFEKHIGHLTGQHQVEVRRLEEQGQQLYNFLPRHSAINYCMIVVLQLTPVNWHN